MGRIESRKKKGCCNVHDEHCRIEILIPFAQKRLLHVGLIMLHEPELYAIYNQYGDREDGSTL